MSRLKSRLVFTAIEAPFVMRAAADCGLSVDQFCRAAVFFAIRKAYEADGGNSNGQKDGDNTESGISSGNTSGSELGQDVTGSALPD